MKRAKNCIAERPSDSMTPQQTVKICKESMLNDLASIDVSKDGYEMYVAYASAMSMIGELIKISPDLFNQVMTNRDKRQWLVSVIDELLWILGSEDERAETPLSYL